MASSQHFHHQAADNFLDLILLPLIDIQYQTPYFFFVEPYILFINVNPSSYT